MPEIEREYDYVVVGAGAAGAIVAAKMAGAGHKVLLLELGLVPAPDNEDVWNPTQWNNLLKDPNFEIGYTSVAQRRLQNRPMNLLQSRGLGGCQIHNAMVYVRGGRATYNHWATKLGCAGWDYHSLLPHFSEVEGALGIVTAAPDPFSQSVIDAATALGYPRNPDYNGGDSAYGSTFFQFTIEELPDGKLRRTTSAEKFITAAALPSLTVAAGVKVRRLLLNKDSEAGVEYIDAAGDLASVHALREVILSAGAIASPAILLRSGVGPADAIRACGMEPFQELPAVGTNFHDDLGCGFPVFAEQALPPTPYGFVGAGIFACDSGNPPSDMAEFGEVNLELQISTSNMGGSPHSPLMPHYALVGASAMHLDSRGTISLDPTNPFGQPLVDPAWLSAPGDMDRCRAALALAQAVAWQPSLMSQWKWMPMPILSPDDWIRRTGTTVQHYVGSCQMGTDPATSVVGTDLRVHGVKGVRVIDASAAPTPVTGNTAGVSMVIGAKGAALLLET